MSLIDAERVAALIREVAKTAILPRFRNLKPEELTEKGPNDLVTVADIESERLLSAGLLAMLPGSTVVGEEAAYADPGVLLRLSGDAPVWILDPVDGTLMFAKGDEGFAVIVALAFKGRTVAGWILDPVGDRMAVAEEGEGAWLDGKRMRVSADRPIADMTGAVWSMKPVTAALKGKVRGWAPWGSAGRAYMALAAGELDFVMFRKLNPWDHAAGVLMHAEAGGKSALFDGAPYRPVPLKSPLLLAPGPESWATLRALTAD
jgi:fructose-1,6-bisphosphatase/inositol monophosphatase family enzyme